MKLSAGKFVIRLFRPFRIAHGQSDTRETILVTLKDAGFEAHGEGALPPYYPSRSEACLRWAEEVAAHHAFDSDTSLEEQLAKIPAAPSEAAAARVAVEIALHDLWAQRQGLPLWKAWGLESEAAPLCARTLSIPTDEQELREMLGEGRSCFKLKLGSGDTCWDEEVVRLARALRPEARLSVDVNGGWSAAEAADLIHRLSDCALEYIEQPVAPELCAWQELRSHLAGSNVPPLVADESLQALEDIPVFLDVIDGVNVKLLKAGGLAPARRWIETARAGGLRIMIGVMVETGIGRTAAAQLAPLADWLDIDPPDSIPVAPFSGFEVREDRIVLPDRPGLGLLRLKGGDGFHHPIA